MQKKILYFLISIIIFFFSSTNSAAARTSAEITDWYIKSFETDIIVNKDSSLLVTENITADCGDLPDKHGIYRILPTAARSPSETFKNPIKLVSITDFNGNPYKYAEIKNGDTITWKIGDADITVRGVNNYRIIYSVQNAVRFGNNNFDEFYWNMIGNYWQMPIDNFSAKISFLDGITKQDMSVDYYTGTLGSKDKSLAKYFWDKNVLYFYPTSTLLPGEGVTVSVTFPKNIFTPYVPSFVEKYGEYFWYLTFLIPIGVFILAFRTWKKYGADPKMKKPIPPEFGIPDDITPIQMGTVLASGGWRNTFVTASIIDLAVRKFITIEQTEEKVLFFTAKEITLRKEIETYDLEKVTRTERLLLNNIFEGGKNSTKLSTLKNNFYKYLPAIQKSAQKDAANNRWITKEGNKYSVIFISVGSIMLFLSFWFSIISPIWFVSFLLSGFIMLMFGVIMPKRTQAGVDLLFKIKGFELYMRQAENYRQQFYEKENIFDKFLPYAIIFGIAGLWVKKMELIYGEDYFKNYHPAWFVGSLNGNFSVDSFTSQLNSITSSISNSTGTSSGAGGSGGSGGGGGGGGGGGW